jgi:uncharacterized protein YggL (DUF469 family)
MHQDEELHDKLLAEFRKYFAENQAWMNEGTKASAIRVRHILSDIRRICSARRVVIREWMDEKEIILAEREAKRQAQKQQAIDTDDAN